MFINYFLLCYQRPLLSEGRDSSLEQTGVLSTQHRILSSFLAFIRVGLENKIKDMKCLRRQRKQQRQR